MFIKADPAKTQDTPVPPTVSATSKRKQNRLVPTTVTSSNGSIPNGGPHSTLREFYCHTFSYFNKNTIDSQYITRVDSMTAKTEK